MRIHTELTEAQMSEARRNSGAPIYFHTLEEHGSRTHPRAFEVRLEGTGGRNNTGLYGAGDYDGATWDEWGAFLGAVYALDPAARCGGTERQPIYAHAQDYHWQTGDRFRDGLPADTHPRHRWVLEGTAATGRYHVRKCGKCGATTRSLAYGHTRAEIFAA
jgi:hypothetical protein